MNVHKRSYRVVSLVGLFLLLTALPFSSVLSRAQAQEEVKVGAGAAPTENIFAKIKEPMEKAIQLKLVLISDGPVAALKSLDEGKVDAAAGGLTFPDWIKLMETDGYRIPDKDAYKYRVIGKDIIKVLAHKDVTVKSLSKEQLKGIFTGKTANWKEAGGPDAPVVVVLGSKIPGTQSVFQKEIMAGEPYVQGAVMSETAADVKQKVLTTPGAVGLGPVSLIDNTVSVPEIPEVGRPITLITKGAPSPTILKMLDFISGEGQKYIGK